MDVLQISLLAPTSAGSQKLVSAAGAKVDSASLPGHLTIVTPDALCFVLAGTPGSQDPNSPNVNPTTPAAVAVDGTNQVLLANNTYRIIHAKKTILSFAGPAAFNVYLTPEP